MVRVILLLLLAGFCHQGIFAQWNPVRDQAKWKEKRSGDPWTEEKEMEILFYPYHSSTLYLRSFKGANPHLKDLLPDSIRITPPELNGYKEVAYALTWLYTGKENEGELLVMIVGNPNSNDPHYFIDWNLNYNLAGDGKAVTFVRMTSKGPKRIDRRRIRVRGEDSDAHTYIFWLNAPEVEDDAPEKEELPEIKEWKHLSLRVLTNLGRGHVHYNYINAATGYPTTFNVATTGKVLGAHLNFRWRGLNLALKGRYESIFYWTSERVTRLGEPFEASGIYFENILVEREREILPRTRLSYGANLEYDIPLGKKLDLAPYAGITFAHYTRPFIPERTEPENSYRIKVIPALEYGLLFKVRFSPRNSILMNFSRQSTRFEPIGFFDPAQNLDVFTRNWNLRLGIGMEIGLW